MNVIYSHYVPYLYLQWLQILTININKPPEIRSALFVYTENK